MDLLKIMLAIVLVSFVLLVVSQLLIGLAGLMLIVGVPLVVWFWFQSTRRTKGGKN